MPPSTVTLEVPYAENESQFLLRAVEVAVKVFRSLPGKSSIGIRELSPTMTAEDHPDPLRVWS